MLALLVFVISLGQLHRLQAVELAPLALRVGEQHCAVVGNAPTKRDLSGLVDAFDTVVHCNRGALRRRTHARVLNWAFLPLASALAAEAGDAGVAERSVRIVVPPHNASHFAPAVQRFCAAVRVADCAALAPTLFVRAQLALGAAVVPRTGLLATLWLLASGSCSRPVHVFGFARATLAHAFNESVDPRAAHDVDAEERLLSALEREQWIERHFE